MLEMKETAYLLANRGPTSLIVLDELGRGTAVEAGSGICWAVCEELLRGTAFVFLATHFRVMRGLADLYPAVDNYHFLVTREDTHQPVYTHTLGESTLFPLLISGNNHLLDEFQSTWLNSLLKFSHYAPYIQP
jgi:DNA mismatch repair ATPase MutS